MLRALSLIGITDFYTLCYIVGLEFRASNVNETFTVAKKDGGLLRVASEQFAGK
jgi:hypothetical protein